MSTTTNFSRPIPLAPLQPGSRVRRIGTSSICYYSTLQDQSPAHRGCCNTCQSSEEHESARQRADEGYTANEDHAASEGHAASEDHAASEGHAASEDHAAGEDHTAGEDPTADGGQTIGEHESVPESQPQPPKADESPSWLRQVLESKIWGAFAWLLGFAVVIVTLYFTIIYYIWNGSKDFYNHCFQVNSTHAALTRICQDALAKDLPPPPFGPYVKRSITVFGLLKTGRFIGKSAEGSPHDVVLVQFGDLIPGVCGFLIFTSCLFYFAYRTVLQHARSRRQPNSPETEHDVDRTQLPLLDNTETDPSSWIPISVARWTTFQGHSAVASGIEPSVSSLEESQAPTIRRRKTDTKGHDHVEASTDDFGVIDPQTGGTNILTFDGGGVRSLSSLIILRRLLEHVNQQEGLRPGGLILKDLFSLVAGTDTGGVIAIMLGKLGMSVDDCITQFTACCIDVFSHPSKRGKWSAGRVKEKYDGSRIAEYVRKLAARSDTLGNGSAMMSGTGHKNGIPCTVLATELMGGTIDDEPAYFCSHNCHQRIESRIYDVAQATTAAPTYFQAYHLNMREFISGACGNHNPSFDIYRHYHSIQNDNLFPKMDMSKVLLVNIGTGQHTQVDEQERPLSAQGRSRRMPATFGRVLDTFRQLNRTTADARSPFYQVKAISRVSSGMLDAHRFAADAGILHTGIDDYRKLQEIERLTNEYINRADVEKELIEVARKLAQDWRAKQNPIVAPLHDSDDDDENCSSF